MKYTSVNLSKNIYIYTSVNSDCVREFLIRVQLVTPVTLLLINWFAKYLQLQKYWSLFLWQVWLGCCRYTLFSTEVWSYRWGTFNFDIFCLLELLMHPCVSDQHFCLLELLMHPWRVMYLRSCWIQFHKKFYKAIQSMGTTLKCPEVWRPCVYMFVSHNLGLDIQGGMFCWYTDHVVGPGFSEVSTLTRYIIIS